MTKKEVRLKTFLLTALIFFSLKGFPQTDKQKRDILLTADSLDECKEVNQNLLLQFETANQIILNQDSVIENFHTLTGNYQKIISGHEILLNDERKISASYRKKFRLWKILSIVFGGLTVYQIVK